MHWMNTVPACLLIISWWYVTSMPDNWGLINIHVYNYSSYILSSQQCPGLESRSFSLSVHLFIFFFKILKVLAYYIVESDKMFCLYAHVVSIIFITGSIVRHFSVFHSEYSPLSIPRSVSISQSLLGQSQPSILLPVRGRSPPYLTTVPSVFTHTPDYTHI